MNSRSPDPLARVAGLSELHSRLDFDFEAYTADNLGRFEAAWSEFKTN
jgi:hypothetical protein